MVEGLYILVFLGSLVTGTVSSLIGLRKARPLPEVLLAHAMFFGLAGFAGGQLLLTGVPSVIVSLGCMVPATIVSVRQSRRALARWVKKSLPSPPETPSHTVELAIAEARRKDALGEILRLRRRHTIRLSLIVGAPILGIAAFYRSWTGILAGGGTMLLVSLMGRYATKPLKNAIRAEAERALADCPPTSPLLPNFHPQSSNGELSTSDQP